MRIARYAVWSERIFCEQRGGNLRWFLGREFSEGRSAHSIFAKNHEQGLSADVARLFSPPFAGDCSRRRFEKRVHVRLPNSASLPEIRCRPHTSCAP